MNADNSSLERLFELAVQHVDNEEIREQLLAIQEERDEIELPQDALAEESKDETNIASIIRGLNFAGKVKLALKGNQTARNLLLKDSNRQIQLFVLSNPRLTEGEITEVARDANVDENVLRHIARNSLWMKNYTTKANLVANPKTPVDVSLKWIKFLKDKDLRLLAKSRNIPQVVATNCRKLIEMRASK